MLVVAISLMRLQPFDEDRCVYSIMIENPNIESWVERATKYRCVYSSIG